MRLVEFLKLSNPTETSCFFFHRTDLGKSETDPALHFYKIGYMEFIINLYQLDELGKQLN